MLHFISKRLLWCLPVLALFASCSEDFEVGAPYKLITVAYGLMNTDDTAHYIRIQKAYYDESKSALDLARIPDSSYYGINDITVIMQELRGAGEVPVAETLRRVDLSLENFPKDSGTFFKSPSYAYKTTRYMNPAYSYRLVIQNNITAERDTAETPIISTAYNSFRIAELDTVQRQDLTFPLKFDDAKYRWYYSVFPANAAFFEEIIRFHYANKNTAGVETKDSFDYLFIRGTADELVGQNPKKFIYEKDIYQAIKEGIGTAPSGVIRYLDSATLIAWAGSNDQYKYIQYNGAQGGLTADQIRPNYTNFKRRSVYGLFTTRAKLSRRRVPIQELTLDALISNSITRDLNIRKRP